MFRFLWFPFFVGCSDPLDTQLDGPNEDAEDSVGPEITHDGIAAPQAFEQDVFVEALVYDADSDVLVVDLVYQAETSADWVTKSMQHVGDGLYQGRIDGSDVHSGGMRYYIRATDTSGNESCLPEECESDPWYFAIVR